MKDCIFCKIVKGEVPSQKIYEDNDLVAFLDANPLSKGHMLVVPKKHYKNLLEIPDELLSRIHLATKKLTKAISDAFNVEEFNILQNNGRSAGQTVFHYHVHIIPRYEEFKLCFGPGEVKTESDIHKAELCNDKVVKSIRKEL
jgi:histidine triad (HIT) family protein